MHAKRKSTSEELRRKASEGFVLVQFLYDAEQGEGGHKGPICMSGRLGVLLGGKTRGSCHLYNTRREGHGHSILCHQESKLNISQ